MKAKSNFVVSENNEYTIGLPIVRIDWPNIFEPKPYTKDGAPKYSCTFLFDPSFQHEEMKPLIEIIGLCENNLAAKKYDLKDKQSPLHYADAEKSKSLPEDYKGCFYLRAGTREDLKPIVMDKTHKIVTEEDVDIYSGCYVRAVVQFKEYKVLKNVGTSCFLKKVLFIEKGDKIDHGQMDSVHFFGEPESGSPVKKEDKDEYQSLVDTVLA